ncbi:hypothetical protein Sango_2288700 [Sesamum angolense]|uniref:CCHC-type domain-containing protein n=1 Tax=Sesamum angolense TaxID=2727404 RepID=A0AAE1WA12_9LAMI|nr:hypothetical protein Sango_2288700 [Sesamum angolense]
MMRVRDLYAVPDRHIQYAAAKAFFGNKMAEGSSVHDHCAQMLSFVEKLEDLKTRIKNDTYIDVFLQLFPPSYDPFVTMIKRSQLAVMLGEALTSKKGKKARRWKNKIKTKSTVLASKPVVKAPIVGKGKKKEVPKASTAKDACHYCHEKGHWNRNCPKFLAFVQGMFVVAINMVANSASWVLDIGCGAHIYGYEFSIIQNYFYLLKIGSSHLLDNQENSQIWHARLGHISQDRIRKLVDSKSLEIDDMDNMPACYALEMAAKLLNMASSKTMAKTLYDIWHSKPASCKYLRACACEAHWTTIKTILKYLRRALEMFLVYNSGELVLERYSDANFQPDVDDAKS